MFSFLGVFLLTGVFRAADLVLRARGGAALLPDWASGLGGSLGNFGIYAGGALLLSVFFLPFNAVFAQVLDLPTGNEIFGVTGNIGEKFGQVQRGDGVKLENPIKFKSLGQLVTAIIDIIVQIAVPIAALFLIYSGYLFVSARGDEKQLEDAKSIFLWTLVGIAVLLGAKVLAGIIEGTIAQIKQ